MQQEELDFFKKWFLDYVDQFSSPEAFIQENIDLKIEHTSRVCENILLLAKAENLEKKGSMLAETIALFHDLGRFEQFTKYRTFNDLESENHALLGVRILENAGILTILSRKEKDLILKAVEYHNCMAIPECTETSSEFLFYLKLIRDADKLDILKLVSEDYEKEEEFRNPALEFDMPDTPGCSEKIVADILNNRMAKLTDTKNLNDIKFLRLSWIFDINFPAAFSLLRERGYLKTILYSIPEIEEVQIVRKHIDSYLNAIETRSRNKAVKTDII